MTDSGLRKEAKDVQCMSIEKPLADCSQELSLGWTDWTEGGCRGLTTELDDRLKDTAFPGLGMWLAGPPVLLAEETSLVAYLSPRARQEVLDNDGFAQGWERGFHDAPHEGLHQGRGDSSSLFHLIQDL